MNRQGVELSHPDDSVYARMVDVTDKAPSPRTTRAPVRRGKRIADRLRRTGDVAKGNVLEGARLAGIHGAKQTTRLIPLCHPLPIDVVEVEPRLLSDGVLIEALARTRAPTGVELETLATAAVAALTVYDMCKAASKDIVIESVCLAGKSGGRSDHWKARGARRGRTG